MADENNVLTAEQQRIYDAQHANRYVDICKSDELKIVRDFLEWLCDPTNSMELAVCQPQDNHSVFVGGDLVTKRGHMPVSLEALGEKILAAYNRVDLEAVQRHRERILEEIRT